MEVKKFGVVYTGKCIHCGLRFTENSMIWAIGEPIHALAHWECAPFFAYHNGWPHPQPFETYSTKSMHEGWHPPQNGGRSRYRPPD